MSDKPIREVAKYTTSRPIWFIYSGMGSQWSTMGKDLLKIDVFKKTFDRCAEAMKPFNFNLYDIVSKDGDFFKRIDNSFVGITAIQVCLTDVLKFYGIVPDRYAGHSVGETGDCLISNFTVVTMVITKSNLV